MTYALNPSFQAPTPSFLLDIYSDPFADIERDTVAYIVGLWAMHKIHTMVKTPAKATTNKESN